MIIKSRLSHAHARPGARTREWGSISVPKPGRNQRKKKESSAVTGLLSGFPKKHSPPRQPNPQPPSLFLFLLSLPTHAVPGGKWDTDQRQRLPSMLKPYRINFPPCPAFPRFVSSCLDPAGCCTPCVPPHSAGSPQRYETRPTCSLSFILNIIFLTLHYLCISK